MKSHALALAPFLAFLGCGSTLGSGPDGGGGSGGSAACQQIATLDQTCTTDGDCVAVLHTTSCCGSASWLGLRATESQRFATLESACDRTYPACGCAAGAPTTDDGSTIAFGGSAAVTCQGGVCKTYSPACGQPCAAGKSCLSCGQDAGSATCSLRCTSDTSCTEAPYTTCQFGFGGGVCTDPGRICTGP
jgi:hypothetical protein